MSEEKKNLSDDLNDMLGDAKETAKNAAHKAEELANEAKEKATELTEKAKERFNEFSEDAKVKAAELKEDAAESLDKAKEKFTCECGGKYVYKNRSHHQKTQLHQNFINNKIID